MDFTINTYKKLLETLRNQGYAFQTFSDFLRSPADKVILLRHDVDARKENSLRFAEIQHEMSIHGSYYFRVVPQSFDKEVIKKVADLGHKIGYHYETMDTVNEKLKVKSALRQAQCDKVVKSKMLKLEQLVDLAYEEFYRNLEIFRKIVPIETICMHGSPLSKYDNRDIWKKYDYRKLGIIGEPYFDVDYNEVAYLTDTGRRWNGDKVSVRDKVESKYSFNFRSTYDIIHSVDQLPDKVMFTFHPQRWTNKPLPWLQELVLQNVKNVVKRWVVSRK